MKLSIKRLWKMDEVRVTTIAIVFAIVLLGLRHRSGVLNNFSDFFFSLGTVLIVVGGTRYIRNVGLFKTFSYMAYKKRWRHGKCGDGEMRPMSMAEYTQNVVMDEMRQKPVIYSLAVGAVGYILAFLLASVR
ncbi:DUF3899 domain-containing protein [Hominifimenecus microfluidus]|uniref:DUF3899 domain-containing protein n=1 Tax=Hominifimenecus microfluidus TaxID=2885348 RepID=A0AAE3EB64_9FIRM|nr:DUF3899 domain-containing protein [Hominifimenecus microfluidus]MCC2230761.1 DUF3899 domain-containing protein [Hominifimenecus microfluidus]